MKPIQSRYYLVEDQGGIITFYIQRISLSRNSLIHAIPDLRGLQEIRGHRLGQLVLLRPRADLVKVATLVLRVEVNEWLGMVRVNPDLAQDSDINTAHQLLTENIETVGCAD